MRLTFIRSFKDRTAWITISSVILGLPWLSFRPKKITFLAAFVSDFGTCYTAISLRFLNDSNAIYNEAGMFSNSASYTFHLCGIASVKMRDRRLRLICSNTALIIATLQNGRPTWFRQGRTRLDSRFGELLQGSRTNLECHDKQKTDRTQRFHRLKNLEKFRKP
jgi:hypothetical protein